MKQPGAIVLFRFPHANLQSGKPRPALLVRKLDGIHQDWLVCMISSQMRHFLSGVDEAMRNSDDDFSQSGLHGESVIRVQRLAVMDEATLLGEIGSVSQARLKRIKLRLAEWLNG